MAIPEGGERSVSGTSTTPRSSAAQRRQHRLLANPFWLARMHPRLFGSLAFGVVTYVIHTLAAPTTIVATRLLVAWNVGILLYLVLAFRMMSRFDLALVRERAAIQDEGGLALLLLTVVAGLASIVAIVAQLGAMPDARRGWYFALAVTTILVSWTFIHAMFALHYAHEYYGDDAEAGGLDFPKEDCPDYWDFVYFAFVIGMTFQVSDVQVTSKVLRRVVVAHGAVSFLFNVAILALVVNLGAGLIQSSTAH